MAIWLRLRFRFCILYQILILNDYFLAIDRSSRHIISSFSFNIRSYNAIFSLWSWISFSIGWRTGLLLTTAALLLNVLEITVIASAGIFRMAATYSKLSESIFSFCSGSEIFCWFQSSPSSNASASCFTVIISLNLCKLRPSWIFGLEVVCAMWKGWLVKKSNLNKSAGKCLNNLRALQCMVPVGLCWK